ncbi:hypothetical protein Esti_002565 [Eimeria stiedai]
MCEWEVALLPLLLLRRGLEPLLCVDLSSSGAARATLQAAALPARCFLQAPWLQSGAAAGAAAAAFRQSGEEGALCAAVAGPLTLTEKAEA